jgi:hypothetical protein
VKVLQDPQDEDVEDPQGLQVVLLVRQVLQDPQEISQFWVLERALFCLMVRMAYIIHEY